MVDRIFNWILGAPSLEAYLLVLTSGCLRADLAGLRGRYSNVCANLLVILASRTTMTIHRLCIAWYTYI